MLEENGIKDYATTGIAIHIDVTHLATYKKDDAKARIFILDAIKDHIVPHILELDTTKKIWDVLLNLYQNATTNRKMILREKVKNT